MKSDLGKFLALRSALEQERARVQARLAEINRALGANAPVASGPAGPTGKRTVSAATKAKMAVAQQARWARLKGETPTPVASPKQKRRMSAAGKANIRAAVKARWAKVNALKGKTVGK